MFEIAGAAFAQLSNATEHNNCFFPGTGLVGSLDRRADPGAVPERVVLVGLFLLAGRVYRRCSAPRCSAPPHIIRPNEAGRHAAIFQVQRGRGGLSPSHVGGLA